MERYQSTDSQREAAGLVYFAALSNAHPDAASNISNPEDYDDYAGLLASWRDASMSGLLRKIQTALVRERSESGRTAAVQSALRQFAQTQTAAISELGRGWSYMIEASFREECRMRCQVSVVNEDFNRLTIQVASAVDSQRAMKIVIIKPPVAPLATDEDLAQKPEISAIRAQFQKAVRQFAEYREAITKAKARQAPGIDHVLNRLLNTPPQDHEEIVTLAGLDLKTT
jgi:hypothetical protein